MVRYGLVMGAIGLFVVGVAAGPKLFAALTQRGATLADPLSQEHVIIRVDAMAEGVQMFRDNPLTGIGLGQFGPYFEAYAAAQIYGSAEDPSYFQQANNDYVQYLATTGILGFAALSALFLSFLLWARRLALAPATSPALRAALVGCFLMIIALLGDATSEDPMWDKSHGVLLFTVFGLIWSAGSGWMAGGGERAVDTLAVGESAHRD
jgi:O-antigen ligase